MSDPPPQIDPPLYIAFSRSVGVEGDLIRDFTGGEVNHALLIYPDPTLKCWLTMGANSNGVTPMALDKFLAQGRQIVKLFLPRFDLWGAVRENVNELDDPYAYRALFAMSFVELGRKMGFNWPNIGERPDEEFCSEWISALVRSALRGVWIHAADDTIDPAELCAVIAGRPNWFDDTPLRQAELVR